MTWRKTVRGENASGECATGPDLPDWCELLGCCLNVNRWRVQA
jgi:hypothetical protein